MIEVLVTGGAGFMGSNFVRHVLRVHPDWRVTTLDKITYAGRVKNICDFINNPRHVFVHGDIADAKIANWLVERSHLVVHFAAEMFVDRSIASSDDFICTNIVGTYVLLEAARRAPRLKRFIQISTEEVYGGIPAGASRETDELRPRNPYSASKVAADRLAYAYWTTYGVPVVITRTSNNYGPYQSPEKLIPLCITQALDYLPVPLCGDGENVRDWLHVSDHCCALDILVERGEPGEIYNIGGGCEVRNIDVAYQILALLDRSESLIKPASDWQAHDRRCCLDSTKLRGLGWHPQVDLVCGLYETVEWYRTNEAWWRPIKECEPASLSYFVAQHGKR
jgi:dTDP-glucose 4,6-dehydratase